MITLIVTFIVGAIVGALVARNNIKKLNVSPTVLWCAEPRGRAAVANFRFVVIFRF